MRIDNKEVEKIEFVLRTLQGKWTVEILCAMRDGPVRFGQLSRLIPRASKKALTASLRWLQDTKIITRRDLSRSVLHVEYQLADNAHEPITALLSYLANWASVLSRSISGRENNLE
jgi:DNA-binding HxlR family transcriptional regulator